MKIDDSKEFSVEEAINNFARRIVGKDVEVTHGNQSNRILVNRVDLTEAHCGRYALEEKGIDEMIQ